MTTPFRKDEPRASTMTLVECFADPALFGDWGSLPKRVRNEFTKNGPIPCDGSGRPGIWCEGCRFSNVNEPEDE